MDTNQDMQKIMEQLERNSRKQTRYARLQCVFSLAAALCCAGLLIAVLSLLPQIGQVVDQAQEAASQVNGLAQQAQVVMDNLETVTRNLASADLAGMVSNVDTLVSSSQEGVVQALEKINTVDIEALNQAIGNLSAVVEPLAKFFKVFQ